MLESKIRTREETERYMNELKDWLKQINWRRTNGD